jgi:hypothetical protein
MGRRRDLEAGLDTVMAGLASRLSVDGSSNHQTTYRPPSSTADNDPDWDEKAVQTKVEDAASFSLPDRPAAQVSFHWFSQYDLSQFSLPYSSLRIGYATMLPAKKAL